MADKPARTLRNTQKVTRMELPQNSKRQPVSHKDGEGKVMGGNKDKGGKLEGRKTKPELALYRPGMGLAQKGRAKQEPRNEDRRPSTPGGSLEAPETLAAFKELNVNDHSGNCRARYKRPDQQVYVPKHLKCEQPDQRVIESGPKATEPKVEHHCNGNPKTAASSPVEPPRRLRGDTLAKKERPFKTSNRQQLPCREFGGGDFHNRFRQGNTRAKQSQELQGPAGDSYRDGQPLDRTGGDGRPAPGKNRPSRRERPANRTRRSAATEVPTARIPSPGREPDNSGGGAEDTQQRSNKKSVRKKKHRHKEEMERGCSNGRFLGEGTKSASRDAVEEEDWEGDLLVVTRSTEASSQEGPNGTRETRAEPARVPCKDVGTSERDARQSFSETEEDPKMSEEPFIKDWSAVVPEEERSCCSPFGDAARYGGDPTAEKTETEKRNHRSDVVRSTAAGGGDARTASTRAPEQGVPPRFQKKSHGPAAQQEASRTSPPKLDVGKGGLLRIPCSVRLGSATDGDEREVTSSGQDKPLIVVKPQPQVMMETTCERSILAPSAYVPPYEPAGPTMLPYGGTVPYGCPQGTTGSGTVPVYQSDQVMAPDIYGRSRIKPLVEKNLHDAALLEREYMTYLSKGIRNADMKAMGHCRWKLQLRYENVILADPRYCAERNVEQALWKSAFYHGIETFRRIMDECPESKEEAKMHLLTLVDEGTIFYENLLDKFQETYGFSLSPFLEAEGAPRPPGLPDSVRLVLISAQKIYICLGDLARYREQALGTTNYGRARNYYLKAQQLAPKNGRPYNQLAILAIYARRKLDAVYYYMRSLAASNPFLTARESLLALFDEARKKYEHMEKKRHDEDGKRPESRVMRRLSEFGDERLEVWIRPDGTSSHRSSRSSDQTPHDGRGNELGELDRLTTVELNKRFVLSFLHVHGKLFTRVGMETFSETAQRMLMEFRCLLQRSPAAVASARHLQLMSINMFTVANTSLKDSSLDPQCRSLLQEQSLQVALAHVAVLLERAAALLQQQEPNGRLPDDALELLPSLKIWTDWMSCQKRLWSPPPTPCDYSTSVKGNVWTTLADLLTVLRSTNLGDVKLYKEPAEDRELVTLPEDSTLAGFVPLLGAPQENYYTAIPCDRELARNYLRIGRIQFFGDYLCGIATPYLEFSVEKKRFVSLITVSDEDSDSEREITYDSSDDDLEVGDSLDDQDVSLKCEEADNEIQKLWSKKEQLRKAKEQRDRQQACVQAVLQEHRSKQATMLEIRPRYLFPDTNCFIDHLPLLQRLVGDGHFHVYVPLVVVNELDGLARGTRQSVHQSAEHLQKVTTTAKAALDYLEGRFAHREPKLRCVTSRGSVMDTMSFRSEDVSDNKGTNDDLILSCCRHYCSDRPDLLLPREPDTPLKLYREAVLITEDRNLCVKALTHHVPVRDLPSFLRWANIS